MRVLVDACVLYPTVMREVIVGCAQQGVIEPRWSARILEEWARAAARSGPEHEVLARGEIAMLGVAFPNAIVPVHPGLEARLWLPDADDVHVLASAIAGSCDAILTVNAKDFPGSLLAEEGVFRADPDAFLRGLLEECPEQVRGVADAVLAKANQLSDRPWEMRALMKKARLPRFGKALA
ncbi:RSP_2648 family PIN domain-containing protein [Yoonia sediminilitoris]|uniref:PIN domain-containing protein n=1 Tax=Yoonia sediminilitoris TaxID=1286148 RepID=A0A2T6KRL1_9RHOB|nr:PIN domain-containing protein [Yoonia sediminilitoris]PUB19193.1 PIN domain-containing protein [Yoonia sediminilitoris]RCW99361.1 PIN domain-containing protein [Yoonia sediminilitoris]